MRDKIHGGYDPMDCSYICKNLYGKILSNNFQGVVHSVFDGSFNIVDDEQRLITCINEKKPMYPNAVQIGSDVSFQSLGIDVKQKVYFSKEIIELKDSNIVLFLNNAKLWNKGPKLSFYKDHIDNVFTKLKEIGITLDCKGDRRGIYPLMEGLKSKINGLEVLSFHKDRIGMRENFIKQRFLDFIQSYMDDDVDNLSNKAEKIIGYGVGLTPSMDDFLSGLMIARIYLSYFLNLNLVDAYQLNKVMIEAIENKTTIVSQEMLKFSSLGETNEFMVDFMLSFLSKVHIDMVTKNLEKVMDIGATSGTDILLGIYVGSCIFLNKFYKEWYIG